YEVARAVRDAMGTSVRLVALTGYGQPDDRERALAAGFDVFLTKPAEMDAIGRAMNGGAPGERPALRI
ncbi:MAG TPA: hybrid sensor histidine kinase/response regulator, partial [Myxococcales bacterium]